MLFNSYAFLLVFLPAAIVIYRIADPYPNARIPVLIALSLAFYGYWDPRNLALIIPSIMLNWFAARVFARTKNGSVTTAAIAGNLAVLALFKYDAFLAENLTAVTGIPIPSFDLALPLGISFFTFHHIMYLADLRRGVASEMPFGKYALYICFFPQVLSGPLVRWWEIIDQFGAAMLRPGWQKRWAVGIGLIVIGLLEKVMLGDPLGRIATPIFEAAELGAVLNGQAWIGVAAFTFQIFFDFAGYTDIAIGLALLFGIQLPRNFDGPYRATSVQDFWRRWHMTLSRFLRDYLYIPLGGNRHGLRRQVAAILVTMALGGLWHGAGWTFVLWGVLHGTALVIVLLWRRLLPPLPSIAGWALTFAFVSFAWIFFRAGTFAGASRMIEGLATLPAPGAGGMRTVLIAAFCAIALPPSHALVARLTERPNRLVAAALAAASIAILLQLGNSEGYEFIYFRF